MGERQLQHDVEKLASDLGLLWHHCPHPVRCRGRRGFPDLIIAGPGGLVAAELKGFGGVRSPGQVTWGYTLQAGGVSYQLWRGPLDWASGRIEDQLHAIAAPR